ncbi:MAG TPA: SDR family oxidoreductase [Candidatus Lustribacter sp.]|nr:SDR family oxidoreductase [Candidatus Lustribacter sp.]
MNGPMKIDLNAKTALVTGGASGIGRACALLLAANGAKVAVADRNAGGAQDVQSEIGTNAIALAVDVADSAVVQTMTDRTLAAFGRIDILVHCAGVSPRRPVVEMSDEEWRATLAINLDGTMFVTRAVARAMIAAAAGGTMIVIASDRGLLGAVNKSAYAASKGGVIAYFKSLAVELAPHSITVNAINPGTTDTPMLRAGMPSELWASRLKTDPLGKMSQPEDIAEMVLFLAGAGGRFMTGQLITTRMRET